MSRVNYYKELSADFSKPGLVPKELADELLSQGEIFSNMMKDTQPEIGTAYSFARV